MSRVGINKVDYKGWPNCLELSNGIAELIITTDVGPRIISYRLCNGKNVFFEESENSGSISGNEYKVYGGHRLWHSPQIGERPNEPDNDSVDYEIKNNTVILKQRTEAISRIQKIIEITLSPDSSEVSVMHRLINKGVWSIEVSAWALSMLAQGGIEIIPWGNRQLPYYLPGMAIVYWPFTKPDDCRMKIVGQYITVKQTPEMSEWFHIGLPNSEGWAVYINEGTMFVKTFKEDPTKEYTDIISSYRTFTNECFLELETASPLKKISPDESVENEEKWYLEENIDVPESEVDIKKNIVPLIKRFV